MIVSECLNSSFVYTKHGKMPYFNNDCCKNINGQGSSNRQLNIKLYRNCSLPDRLSSLEIENKQTDTLSSERTESYLAELLRNKKGLQLCVGVGSRTCSDVLEQFPEGVSLSSTDGSRLLQLQCALGNEKIRGALLCASNNDQYLNSCASGVHMKHIDVCGNKRNCHSRFFTEPAYYGLTESPAPVQTRSFTRSVPASPYILSSSSDSVFSSNACDFQDANISHDAPDACFSLLSWPTVYKLKPLLTLSATNKIEFPNKGSVTHLNTKPRNFPDLNKTRAVEINHDNKIAKRHGGQGVVIQIENIATEVNFEFSSTFGPSTVSSASSQHANEYFRKLESSEKLNIRMTIRQQGAIWFVAFLLFISGCLFVAIGVAAVIIRSTTLQSSLKLSFVFWGIIFLLAAAAIVSILRKASNKNVSNQSSISQVPCPSWHNIQEVPFYGLQKSTACTNMCSRIQHYVSVNKNVVASKFHSII